MFAGDTQKGEGEEGLRRHAAETGPDDSGEMVHAHKMVRARGQGRAGRMRGRMRGVGEGAGARGSTCAREDEEGAELGVETVDLVLRDERHLVGSGRGSQRGRVQVGSRHRTHEHQRRAVHEHRHRAAPPQHRHEQLVGDLARLRERQFAHRKTPG